MARITDPTGEVIADTKRDGSAREQRTKVLGNFRPSTTTRPSDQRLVAIGRGAVFPAAFPQASQVEEDAHPNANPVPTDTATTYPEEPKV